MVGDCPLDDGVRALVHACREAFVNAARHSGARGVSAYVEVEDDLSPLGDGTPTEEPTDTVDDDLSPNGDSH